MSSQPISLPSTNTNSDYTMGSGSYTGSPNGSFNPASYTRHFLGSPISWRAGSLGFGGRVFPNGSPMDHMLTTVEYNKQSASYESDRGSIINALGMVDREDELCRNYQCCGLQLTDLHALVEHFEQVHIILVDNPAAPGGQHAQIGIPFNPQPIPTVQHQQVTTGVPSVSQHPRVQATQQMPGQMLGNGVQQAAYPVPFDPDEMELDMDMSGSMAHSAPHVVSNESSPSSGAPTPPDTPVSTPLSAYSSPIAYPSPKMEMHPHLAQLQVPTSPYSGSPHNSPYTSQPPSPLSSVHNLEPLIRSGEPSPAVGRPNLNLNITSFSRPPSAAPQSHLSTPEPFNAYGARYAADYSVAGAKLEGDAGMDGPNPQPASVKMECVPPSLVFSNAPTPEATPNTSCAPSPTLTKPTTSLPSRPKPAVSIPTPASVLNASNPVSANASPSVSAPPSPSTKTSVSLSRAHTASLLLSKPFKCPKPNCNKSYKQANGLKYHITHGSCNFAPPKDLEHVQAILERKRRDRAAQAAAEGGDDRSGAQSSDPLSESDLREVEREAELRLRPFACGIGDCTRRYKNMNGLRYHYQHSGEHGVIGLGMLASGVHECLNNGQGGNNRDGVRDASREGRKTRPNSKPSSRSGSRTTTPAPNTPTTPSSGLSQVQAQHLAQAAVVASLQQQSSFPQASPSSSSLAPAATAQVQAQAQLAYQHAQLTQLQQQIAQVQQQSPTQQQQLQQLQAQFAALQSRLYSSQTA